MLLPHVKITELLQEADKWTGFTRHSTHLKTGEQVKDKVLLLSAILTDGTTSSSDGQRFRVGGKADSTGHVNPKFGSEPGRLFYTHISDQYTPFSGKVINVGIRDSTYVLDPLLYPESERNPPARHINQTWLNCAIEPLDSLLPLEACPNRQAR